MQLWVVLLCVVFVLLFAWFLKKYRKVKSYSHIPGPKATSIFFGNALEFKDYLEDISALYLKWAKEYGPIYKIRIFGDTNVVVSSPELAKAILKDGQNNYQPPQTFMRSSTYHNYSKVFGLSTQTATGEHWRWRRQALNPAFAAKHITKFLLPFVVKKCDQLCMEIDSKLGKPVDMDAKMCQITMEIISYYLFGEEIDFSTIGGPVGVADCMERMLDELMGLAQLPTILHPLPRKRKKLAERGRERIAKLVRPYIEKVRLQIEEEKSQAVPKKSKRAPFKSVVYEMLKDKTYTPEEVVEELTGLMFAGHDTTTHTLAFGLYALSQNPRCEEICLEEVREVLGDLVEPRETDRTEEEQITTSRFGKLDYTLAIVRETLRVYSIAWAIGSENTQDIELGGYKIPANSQVTVFFRGIGQNKEYFPRTDEFLPERFLPNNDITPGGEAATNFAFSLGAHGCLGKYLALLETRAVISFLVHRYTWKPAPGYECKFHCAGTLSPVGGMPLVFSLRE
eukprot:CAMPEP_0174255050 /NCGR_PEP_ID=MMETSP0439-20130205/4386_1 /TAXON_ID=0 /ORGANISM="Stereomyxa ramosa, Strain Chinc5" /LENGTH=509 /DNA_ID=CAMNT_0015337031 /DNA_START=21 /DNA_END=1550 /DNA_ORIENTATION=-